MNATLVLAPPARELYALLKVSQDWVLDADQSRVLGVPAVFAITTGWDEVAVLPWAAVKLSEVEVVTERIAGFETVTVIEVEVAVLL